MTTLRPPTAPTLPVGMTDLLAAMEASATFAARAGLVLTSAMVAAQMNDGEAARRHMGEAAEILQRAGIALGVHKGGRPAAGPRAWNGDPAPDTHG